MTLSRESDSGLRILSGWVGDRAMTWRAARNAREQGVELGGGVADDRCWHELEDAIRDAHRRGVSIDALASSAGLRPRAVGDICELADARCICGAAVCP